MYLSASSKRSKRIIRVTQRVARISWLVYRCFINITVCRSVSSFAPSFMPSFMPNSGVKGFYSLVSIDRISFTCSRSRCSMSCGFSQCFSFQALRMRGKPEPRFLPKPIIRSIFCRITETETTYVCSLSCYVINSLQYSYCCLSTLVSGLSGNSFIPFSMIDSCHMHP